MDIRSGNSKQKSNFPTSPSKIPFVKEAEKFFRSNKKPTLKHVLSWENSFQTLMDDKHGRAKLREFMKSEYSEENLDFFLECEEFMKTTDEKKRKCKARKIYNDFISSDADKEINVDFQTRGDITRRIISAPADIFTEAQRRIFVLMEKDIYPRFLKSSIMRSLKEQMMSQEDRSSSSNLSTQYDASSERTHSAPSRLRSTAVKSTSLDIPSMDELAISASSSNKASTSNYQLKSSNDRLTISRV